MKKEELEELEELEEQACQCEGPCESDACCEAQAEAQAPQKATSEEVEVKFEELRELVNQFEERVIVCCLFEREGMLHLSTSISDSVLKSDEKDSRHLSWAAARGYIKKVNACFTNNPEAIGTGVRYMLED